MYIILPLAIHGQADYPWLRSGDELYNRNAFGEAETSYRKALETKDQATVQYNLGNSVYRQNRLPEAIASYEKTLKEATDPGLKSAAWFNLGNAHFQQQDYANSIKAYKEALKLFPDDTEAKKNLMLAMKQQQAQQQQQQDQQKEEEKKEQEQQNQPQQNQNNQDDQSSSNSSSSNKPQSPQDQFTPEKVSEEEARDILKAMEREDQRVQEKLKKAPGKTTPPLKDW